MTVRMTPAEHGLLSLALRDILRVVRDYGTGYPLPVIRQVMLERYGIAVDDADLDVQPGMVDAPPWGRDQVASLAAYQHSGAGHPFTCGNDECREATGGAPLDAVANGWLCSRCGYTQDWAWAFMTDFTWRLAGPWPLIVFQGAHGPIQPPGGRASPRKDDPC